MRGAGSGPGVVLYLVDRIAAVAVERRWKPYNTWKAAEVSVARGGGCPWWRRVDSGW